MAAANPPQPAQAAGQNTVLVYRDNEIGAAAGVKTAARAEPGANQPLIASYCSNNDRCRQSQAGLPRTLHFVDPWLSAKGSLSIRRAVKLFSDACNGRTCGLARGCGRTTMSKPAGSSCWTSRKASRSERFQRFRTTALPSLRETVRPSRGCEYSLRAA